MTTTIEDDDDPPMVDDDGFRVLRPDVPPLRSAVAYRMDAEAAEQAATIRRLNELGAIGVAEERADYDEWRAKRSRANLEVMRREERSPWLVHPLIPPKRGLSWRAKASLALAGVLLLAVAYAALASATPPSSVSGGSKNDPNAAISCGTTDRVGLEP